MKLFDFFKKKKEEKKEKVKEEVKPRKEVKKEEKVEKISKVEKKKEKEIKKPPKVSIPKAKEKKIDLAWKVLETPHISEKATDLTKQNKYVFRVFPKSNKKEIKKAVEDIYGIDVLNVRIIKIPRKKKMRGRVSGWKKGYKKAIVKVKEGQKIELLPR